MNVTKRGCALCYADLASAIFISIFDEKPTATIQDKPDKGKKLRREKQKERKERERERQKEITFTGLQKKV